jgi:hypothetical protein
LKFEKVIKKVVSLQKQYNCRNMEFVRQKNGLKEYFTEKLSVYASVLCRKAIFLCNRFSNITIAEAYKRGLRLRMFTVFNCRAFFLCKELDRHCVLHAVRHRSINRTSHPAYVWEVLTPVAGLPAK